MRLSPDKSNVGAWHDFLREILLLFSFHRETEIRCRLSLFLQFFYNDPEIVETHICVNDAEKWEKGTRWRMAESNRLSDSWPEMKWTTNDPSIPCNHHVQSEHSWKSSTNNTIILAFFTKIYILNLKYLSNSYTYVLEREEKVTRNVPKEHRFPILRNPFVVHNFINSSLVIFHSAVFCCSIMQVSWVINFYFSSSLFFGWSKQNVVDMTFDIFRVLISLSCFSCLK